MALGYYWYAWTGMLETYDLALTFVSLPTGRSGVPDGQPKLLLSFIPDYPMLNFLLITSIYVAVMYWKTLISQNLESMYIIHFLISCLQMSYRLFELTNTLKNAFVPSKDNKRLASNLITGVVVWSILYSLSFVFLKFPRIWVSCDLTINLISHRHIWINSIRFYINFVFRKWYIPDWSVQPGLEAYLVLGIHKNGVIIMDKHLSVTSENVTDMKCEAYNSKFPQTSMGSGLSFSYSVASGVYCGHCQLTSLTKWRRLLDFAICI